MAGEKRCKVCKHPLLAAEAKCVTRVCRDCKEAAQSVRPSPKDRRQRGDMQR